MSPVKKSLGTFSFTTTSLVLSRYNYKIKLVLFLSTARVGFSENLQPAGSSITIGVKQKQAAEDPTIAIVKNIYR